MKYIELIVNKYAKVIYDKKFFLDFRVSSKIQNNYKFSIWKLGDIIKLTENKQKYIIYEISK